MHSNALTRVIFEAPKPESPPEEVADAQPVAGWQYLKTLEGTEPYISYVVFC